MVAAALALPGAAPAQTGPGPALVGVRVLNYHDWQPGLDRIRVNSPALTLQTPVGDRWGVETALTTDSVSGASPRYHSAVSGASRMNDRRRAGDLRITRYEERSSWSLGMAGSHENDFRSRALSAQGSWSTADNNRTWTAGIGHRLDRIGSVNAPDLDERRRTLELAVGVTQALSRRDLLQIGITHANGHGYYSDPYKLPDLRPDSRRQTSATVRWHHHLEGWDTTLRASYRLYGDSFGIRSHTATLEPVVALAPGVTLAPSVRLYSQGAASFYYNPVRAYSGVPAPPGYFDGPPVPLSADQRLSAFGALTLGLRLAVEFGDGWQADIRIERYEQRSAWHLRGQGSRGIDPFSASFVQWGLVRRF